MSSANAPDCRRGWRGESAGVLEYESVIPEEAFSEADAYISSVMRWSVIAGLVLCVTLAGCVGPLLDRPANQERPVKFVADNTVNSTHSFEVFVLDLPANVTYRRNDGMTEKVDIGGGMVTYDPGDGYYFTNVEPTDSSRLHGRFRVEPGETHNSSIKNPPRGFAIVVVVYQSEDKIVGFASSTCDDLKMAKLRVTRNTSPLSVTTACV
jgi:hypothetical protein